MSMGVMLAGGVEIPQIGFGTLQMRPDETQAAVEEALADGRLVELPVDMEAPTLSPVCAHHKGKWVSPLLQCFLDLVTQAPLL